MQCQCSTCRPRCLQACALYNGMFLSCLAHIAAVFIARFCLPGSFWRHWQMKGHPSAVRLSGPMHMAQNPTLFVSDFTVALSHTPSSSLSICCRVCVIGHLECRESRAAPVQRRTACSLHVRAAWRWHAGRLSGRRSFETALHALPALP